MNPKYLFVLATILVVAGMTTSCAKKTDAAAVTVTAGNPSAIVSSVSAGVETMGISLQTATYWPLTL